MGTVHSPPKPYRSMSMPPIRPPSPAPSMTMHAAMSSIISPSIPPLSLPQLFRLTHPGQSPIPSMDGDKFAYLCLRAAGLAAVTKVRAKAKQSHIRARIQELRDEAEEMDLRLGGGFKSIGIYL